MTSYELLRICETAINQVNRFSLPGPAKISLKMPENKRCPPKRRIFGRRGPFGHVVAFGFDGFDTVVFDAQEVKSFILSEAKRINE
jgi:hypothetical protein